MTRKTLFYLTCCFTKELPTFAARQKKVTGTKQFFKNKNQGNEQLRIDGDFYPCAI